MVPRNPLGPVLTAASLQIAAAISNFALVGYPGRTWHSLLADRPDGDQSRASPGTTAMGSSLSTRARASG
ncbi:hypothetical protein AB0F91_42500 [Amycolatopsis sp. NPDC023774]|uniref:hypothetical protein n=1 Tax=Amycolatopsis sp. NPDC023774 TaxID=3155015 RepID=UPI0033C3686F